MSDGVLVEVEGSTRVLTLDVPEHGNRLPVGTMRALIGALRAAREEDALLLVLRAEGPDFCLGRLQGEVVEGLSRQQSLRLILEANTLLRTFPGVSVALVQGRAYGFGAGLATQCDLTVAETSSAFAFDEVAHGLAPLVVAEYLPRFVGSKRAQSLVLTGREIDGTTAEAWGIVTELVGDGELADAGKRIISHLGDLEPGALRLMKRYALALHDGVLGDAPSDGIDWLDAWLSAGRPAAP